MTCDDINLLIDDYVDGACDELTAASLRHHLRDCAACRALASDLARIRDAAASLGPVAPPPDVWAAVRARVESGDAAASAMDWRQLLAAAAGFALLVTGLSWLGANLPSAAPGVQLAGAALSEQFQLAEAAYQVAIDDLESITTQAAGPTLAEPAFVALQASLVDLDEAIGEARGRLSIEPDDEFSQDNLLAALDNKIIVLQDAVALLDRTEIEASNP
jgi:predicted anti-sigma-YlaC factor YlaD